MKLSGERACLPKCFIMEFYLQNNLGGGSAYTMAISVSEWNRHLNYTPIAVPSLRLTCLKDDGVKPVTFLNWADKCATLL